MKSGAVHPASLPPTMQPYPHDVSMPPGWFGNLSIPHAYTYRTPLTIRTMSRCRRPWIGNLDCPHTSATADGHCPTACGIHLRKGTRRHGSQSPIVLGRAAPMPQRLSRHASPCPAAGRQMPSPLWRRPHSWPAGAQLHVGYIRKSRLHLRIFKSTLIIFRRETPWLVGNIWWGKKPGERCAGAVDLEAEDGVDVSGHL